MAINAELLDPFNHAVSDMTNCGDHAAERERCPDHQTRRMTAPVEASDSKAISLVDATALRRAVSTSTTPAAASEENEDRGRDAEDRPRYRTWLEGHRLAPVGGVQQGPHPADCRRREFLPVLALFPALAAFVSLYGFVADPVTVADHVAYIGGLLPPGGWRSFTSSSWHWLIRIAAARRRILRWAGNRFVERQQRHQGAARRHEHCL